LFEQLQESSQQAYQSIANHAKDATKERALAVMRTSPI